MTLTYFNPKRMCNVLGKLVEKPCVWREVKVGDLYYRNAVIPSDHIPYDEAKFRSSAGEALGNWERDLRERLAAEKKSAT